MSVADPLADLNETPAATLHEKSAVTEPSSTTEAGTTAHGNAKRTRTLLLIGGASILLLVIVAVYLLSGPEDLARKKNDTIVPLTATLGAERDYEWANEQTGRNDVWKKSHAWLNRAKPTLSETAVRSEIDPWRSERWEIEYRAGHTLESYVRELDALRIEIGLLGVGTDGTPGDPIYLSDLTNAIPKTRNGKLADESRYYMLWRVGSLKTADSKLFATAKLNPQGKYVAHFYPAAVEQDMVAREATFADGRPIEDIRKTIFSIRPQGGGFAMVAIRQEYHDGGVKELTANDPDYGGTGSKPKLAPKPKPIEPPKPAAGDAALMMPSSTSGYVINGACIRA